LTVHVIGEQPGIDLEYHATLAWLERAAGDPLVRHPKRLPATLDFRPHADLFLRTYHASPAGTETGFPLVIRDGALHFPTTLTSQARYQPFLEGGAFLGTFHAHPPDRAPFFDPQDLANTLRSDNAGFLDLLLSRDRLYALVRANPYLYISAHHVNRNPLLLQEQHVELLRRAGGREPHEPEYDEAYRKAGLYYFQRYQLALYEGDPQSLLRRTVTPEGSW
jgi:hypothetical protein